jgi:hypothetical protein
MFWLAGLDFYVSFDVPAGFGDGPVGRVLEGDLREIEGN